ncbi:putative aarF domain-containing protein kinase [Citrus sinensis]|nr:putative aarF domain-containing protein kinase [Citrus sinensis]
MTLLLFASPPIPALPANQQLKIYGKPINHRHLKSSRVSATRDDVDAFTEKSSYLFKLSSTDADSIVEYDLRKIASVYRRKPLILLRRVFQVGTTFGWWFGSRFVDELMERSDQMFPVRAAELRKILVELGPAYVKIAQAVSSRPDLIPPSYLDELSLLQDQITPFSSEVAFNTIEQELGLPIDELFSEISPEPVAAASLGQVYQARLRQSGRVVAVKVQRPGVQAAISLDIFILHFIAGLIRKARKFNTDLQELDYKIEAKNGLKFRQLYGGIQDVLIPEMYVEQTTRKVLIMEWVEGQKLSEVKDLYLIEVGVYCSFNQLLEKGFYHADPHPGNLFRSYDGKLAYIDFGMMGEFKEELREGFIEACLHLVNRDFDALAKDFVTLGLLPPTAEKEAVTKALTGVFQNAVAKGVRNISFGDLLGNLGATILAVLEGIAISSNPNYKVLGSTYPYIARKVLTDSSPQLKSSLVALLYKEGVFRIDRLESLLTESLRARTEKALVKKQTEDTDSRLITKEILSFTLTEKGAFVREILLQEFAKGLDALGIATLDYFTSAVIPFAAPFSFSSLTEEDRINLTNLRRLLLLLSRVQSSKSASVEVKEGSIYKNQTTYSEEASLVFYQLASAQEVLPILSVIPELPPELQQEFLHLPADLAGRLISRAAARTIRRMFL